MFLALNSLVYSAKKNTPSLKVFDPNKQIANFIDATDPNRASARSESAEPAKDWHNCKVLKVEGERLFCRKFHCFCAQNKCPQKFIEVD